MKQFYLIWNFKSEQTWQMTRSFKQDCLSLKIQLCFKAQVIIKKQEIFTNFVAFSQYLNPWPISKHDPNEPPYLYNVLHFQTVGWPRKDKLTSIQYEQLESSQDLNKMFGIQNQIHTTDLIAAPIKIDLSFLNVPQKLINRTVNCMRSVLTRN